MKLTPVRAYTAHYPTRDTLDTQPDLLRRLPARWRRNALVLAAIGAAGTLAYAAAKDEKPTSRVAPLFQLQAERCVMMGKMAAPTFLSEEEARTIVLDELKAANIAPAADAQTLKDVFIVFPTVEGVEHKPEAKMPIVLDGTDAKKKIAFEFVSADDYRTLAQENEARWMQRNQMQDAATALRDGLVKAKPDGAYGIFYDPITYDAKATREELRKQVKDFIAWLKAEKVI